MRIDVLSSLPTEPGLSPYQGNRAPLCPTAMIKLPLGAVQPKGWIRHQLDLMNDGMTGCLEEISEFLGPDNGWLTDGAPGWEEQPYWLRGFYPLAVLTGHAGHLETAHQWIEAVLNSQDEDGWFGSSYHKHRPGTYNRQICDFWPAMVMLYPLRFYYEASGDQRVLDLMARFFAYCSRVPDEEFIPQLLGSKWQAWREEFGDWKIGVQVKRAGEMLPHLYWFYNQTGNADALQLAHRFYRSFLPPMDHFLDNHAVNFAQRHAYPAFYGQQVDLERGLRETEFWYQLQMQVWGRQPRGIFSADELIRAGKTDPRYGFETCGMIEFASKFYELGRITGDALYADRAEDILLNHFPATMTPDLKGVHYITASNMPQLDCDEGHCSSNSEEGRGAMLYYSPHKYRCCQHNVGMGWTLYAQNLWQASADGGLVAWLYGASEVEARVKGGQAVGFRQATDYPFKGTICIEMTKGEGEFPLYLRIPSWQKGVELKINGELQRVENPDGKFLRIERDWVQGDRIDLAFAMEISTTVWPGSGAHTVDCGPLSYSIRISEHWKACGGTEKWPETEVLPASPWNFGLVLDEQGRPGVSKEVRVAESLPEQPWSSEHAPVVIKASAKKIPNWTLEGGSPQELQRSPVLHDGPVEEVEMIPLGCARLRMSCLPVIGTTGDARPWHAAVPEPNA